MTCFKKQFHDELYADDLILMANCKTGLRKIPFPRHNLLPNQLSTHDTTYCPTSLTTGWMFVYTMQPVAQPVVQPVWQPAVSCKRGIRGLYIGNCVRKVKAWQWTLRKLKRYMMVQKRRRTYELQIKLWVKHLVLFILSKHNIFIWCIYKP